SVAPPPDHTLHPPCQRWEQSGTHVPRGEGEGPVLLTTYPRSKSAFTIGGLDRDAQRSDVSGEPPREVSRRRWPLPPRLLNLSGFSAATPMRTNRSGRS